MNRRNFLKGMLALPVLGVLGLMLPEPAKAEWHHIAEVGEGGTYAVYRDGRLWHCGEHGGLGKLVWYDGQWIDPEAWYEPSADCSRWVEVDKPWES